MTTTPEAKNNAAPEGAEVNESATPEHDFGGRAPVTEGIFARRAAARAARLDPVPSFDEGCAAAPSPSFRRSSSPAYVREITGRNAEGRLARRAKIVNHEIKR